jgi:hypothetical protein
MGFTNVYARFLTAAAGHAIAHAVSRLPTEAGFVLKSGHVESLVDKVALERMFF